MILYALVLHPKQSFSAGSGNQVEMVGINSKVLSIATSIFLNIEDDLNLIKM